MSTAIAPTPGEVHRFPCVVGGVGAYHTDEPGKPDRRPYLNISLADIRALADHPPSVGKAQGRWIIPSTRPTRSFSEQAQNGVFAYLWSDIDAPPGPLARLRDTIDLDVLRCRNAEFYTSRGATPAKQKFRILIPLAKPVDPALWLRSQVVLHLGLKAVGVMGDLAVLRHGQLCYLPNRGAYYESLPRRDGMFLDPATHWSAEIAALVKAERRAVAADEAQKEAHRQAMAARRAAQSPRSTSSIIEQFNAAYSVEDVLLEAGYVRRGDTFRHPNSESKSFSCRVFEGRAFSLSPADPLWSGGAGGHAHDAFSAFCAIHYQGNAKTACKAASERLGVAK